MPGIGIITNANARVHRMFPFFKHVLRKMVGRKGELIATLSIDELEKTVADFLKWDLDIIAISGGDGTIHRTLDTLLKACDDPSSLPPILTLPSGTMNIIPKALGIGGGTVYNLAMAVMMYNHDIPMRIVKRNLLQVNENYSMLFGIGAPVKLLDINYSTAKSRTGATKMFVKYFSDLALGGKLFKEILAPFNYSYQVDNGEFQEISTHTLFASFTEKLPFGFRFFPLATRQRGEFEIVMLDFTPMQGFIKIPLMWNGNTVDFRGMHRQTASSLKIRCEEPQAYTLDGDIYPPQSVFEIKSGPELRFLVPAGLSYLKSAGSRAGRTSPWGKSLLR